MQKSGNQPVMKRVARPRGAGGMDFGVQVYAKAPPAPQECGQVCYAQSIALREVSPFRRDYVPGEVCF